MSVPLIETKGLKKYFKTPKGELHAVDDVNLKIEKGNTLGVVGESGCGKTVTALSIAGLLPESARITSGRITLDGEDLLSLTPAKRQRDRVCA